MQWNAGSYKITWDGTDLSGNQVGSGTYLLRMKAGEFTEVRKMMLLK